MGIFKEYREFFLRATQVNSGVKADQEVGFPIEYQVGNEIKKNRFLKGHFPSKNVFIKLFESITFKLNREDTAKENEQGLVKKATDAQAKANDNGNDGFTLATTPSQLPTVIEAKNYKGNIVLSNSPEQPDDAIQVTKDVDITTRNEFKVSIRTSFIGWLLATFNRVVTYVNSIDISNGSVTYSDNPLLQNKVNISKTLASNDVSTVFKADIVLPPIPTIDITAITNSVITALTSGALNLLDFLPVGFTTDITTQAELNANFNLITGLGKPDSKYSKWGIIGLATGTLDIKGKTLRYLDVTDITNKWNQVGMNNLGNDTPMVGINNLPPHTHKYGWSFVDDYGASVPRVFSLSQGSGLKWLGSNQPSTGGHTVNAGGTFGFYETWANTDNGTDNLIDNTNPKIKSNPDALSVINKYSVVAKIIKLTA